MGRLATSAKWKLSRQNGQDTVVFRTIFYSWQKKYEVNLIRKHHKYLFTLRQGRQTVWRAAHERNLGFLFKSSYSHKQTPHVMKSSKSIDELAVAIPENRQSRQISQGTNLIWNKETNSCFFYFSDTNRSKSHLWIDYKAVPTITQKMRQIGTRFLFFF